MLKSQVRPPRGEGKLSEWIKKSMCMMEVVSNFGSIIHHLNGLGNLLNLSFQMSIGYSMPGAVPSTEG
jgi:hypothetical protein